MDILRDATDEELTKWYYMYIDVVDRCNPNINQQHFRVCLNALRNVRDACRYRQLPINPMPEHIEALLILEGLS